MGWLEVSFLPRHDHVFRTPLLLLANLVRCRLELHWASLRTDPQNSKKQPKLKKCESMLRSLPTATPPKVRGKSKGNRSVRCIPGGNEAIWDEELHAALIEGKIVLTAKCTMML